MLSAPRESTSGFTLIELLVVIGIIAILSAILVPTVGSASRRGKTIKCIANAREIASALNQFAYDHQNRYPGEKTKFGGLGFGDLGGAGRTAGGVSTISDAPDRPLYPYIQAVDIFECPSDEGSTEPASLAHVFDGAGSSYMYPIDHGDTEAMGIMPVEDEKITSFSALSKKITVFEPTFFSGNDPEEATSRWHIGKEAGVLSSVLAFGDGHAAFEESEGYTDIPDLQDDDELAERDYY